MRRHGEGEEEDGVAEKKSAQPSVRGNDVSRHPSSLGDHSQTVGTLRRVVPLPLCVAAPQPSSSSSTSTIVQQQCDCVTLVTAERLQTRLYRPVLARRRIDYNHEQRLLTESPTLRHLYYGYRNYVENDWSQDEHLLTAYTCRSSRSKLFAVHKTISCRLPPDPEDVAPTLACHPFAIINQYLNIFSSLVDFNYTWMVPGLKYGLCNALVVDKRWTYSEARRLHIPCYRLLVKDGYTDLAVGEMHKVENRGTRIKYVRFLSTSTTALYTNRRALFARPDNTEVKDDERARVRPVAPPPKKRRPINYQETHESSVDTSRTAEETGRREILRSEQPVPSTSTGGGSRSYDLNMQRSRTTSMEILNPTLVVFKHSMEEDDPDTLLCNIIVELNLGDTLQY